MKKRVAKRLALNRETLMGLEATTLDRVAGAIAGNGPTLSCYHSCDVPCQTNERSYCVGICKPL
ncbi:MAG TPA: hypothetical protein VIA62_17060 [Thermoanaerobaculia bacterium]|jgi:hypothetical protein|nr:hypothetical protein [Thermoanaerobaculia bacterium]